MVKVTEQTKKKGWVSVIAMCAENKALLLVPKYFGVGAIFLYETIYANCHVSKQKICKSEIIQILAHIFFQSVNIQSGAKFLYLFTVISVHNRITKLPIIQFSRANQGSNYN
jgi:hypothetical protein